MSTDMGIEFRRVQFPVKLSYAMTINKSQGQSLRVVSLDLSVLVFSHGQLYVGCSRVGNPENLFVLSEQPGKADNVVYHKLQ